MIVLLPTRDVEPQAPSDRYRCIVADPPWSYRNAWRTRRGNAGHYGGAKAFPRRGSGAAANYPTLELEQLARLPVASWADVDAHLYLWVTNAFVRQGHELAEAWGFTPINMITWIKPQIGLGFYFRNTTEHVLFAVRGRLPTLRRDIRTHFKAPRTRHSEKPARFYRDVRRYSPGPYLDVFARRKRRGWHVYGNEIESDIALVDLGAPARPAAPREVRPGSLVKLPGEAAAPCRPGPETALARES